MILKYSLIVALSSLISAVMYTSLSWKSVNEGDQRTIKDVGSVYLFLMAPFFLTLVIASLGLLVYGSDMQLLSLFDIFSISTGMLWRLSAMLLLYMISSCCSSEILMVLVALGRS